MSRRRAPPARAPRGARRARAPRRRPWRCGSSCWAWPRRALQLNAALAPRTAAGQAGLAGPQGHRLRAAWLVRRLGLSQGRRCGPGRVLEPGRAARDDDNQSVREVCQVPISRVLSETPAAGAAMNISASGQRESTHHFGILKKELAQTKKVEAIKQTSHI